MQMKTSADKKTQGWLEGITTGTHTFLVGIKVQQFLGNLILKNEVTALFGPLLILLDGITHLANHSDLL